MPAFAPTAQDGLQVADASKTGPRGKIPTFFYDTGKRGIPRFEDMLTIRALEKTHTVSLAMDTIKGQVASTPWSVVPTVDNPSSSHEQASDMIEEFLDGRFNRNRESFDHLVKRWVGDILSIDAGIIEKVPVEDGGPLAELYVRDGASYVKAPDKHEVLPSDDDEQPAYWQFPLTRDAMIRRRQKNQPLREFQEAFEGLQGYGSLFRKPIPFKREQLVWTEHSPVSWQVYGLGRVMKAKKVIEIVLHQDITNKKYFTGNELPEGIVNVIDGSKTEVQRFREYMNEEHKGREHTLAIVGGRELDYQRFRPELKDLQFLESQEWYNKLIWMLFGLSANEVGLIEDVNRSAGEVQDIVVWRKTTKPLLNLLEQEINRKLLPFMEEYAAVNGEVAFSWEPEHPAVKQMKREREREDLSHGILTINEVRRERGLEEKPWGDMPAELLTSIARSRPEWAVEAWDLLDEGEEAPAPPMQGMLDAATQVTKEDPAGTIVRASFNPYAGSKANLSQPVAWKADLDRDTPEHPPLEGHAEDTARMVGTIFQELGDDLEDMVERAFSDDVPEAARRNADTKQPSPRGPADQVVDEIDITESLTRVITEQNLVAMEEGATHHAERLNAEIEERLDEDTAQASIGFNVEDTTALDEMRESAAARMVTVNETIKEKIRRIIVDTFEDGGNVTTLTRALREQVDELSTSHARLVARTETLMASRQGSQALAETNDLVGGKEWVATRDTRTRPWHMAMHGEIVPVQDKFTVPSGWQGAPDYQPADYPRTAKVVGMDQPFNCRCSMSPVLREDMPSDVTELSKLDGITIKGVPPLVDTAHGSRGKEVMREHALPAESFDQFVARIVEEADSVRSLAGSIGVGKATMYDWIDRAGVEA